MGLVLRLPANRHWSQDRCLIPVVLSDSQSIQLRGVDSYKHLGTFRTTSGGLAKELQFRTEQARAVYAPLRARLLGNDNLYRHERQQWLVSLVLSRLMHGAGTWNLPCKKLRKLFETRYMVFRSRCSQAFVASALQTFEPGTGMRAGRSAYAF